MPNSGLMLTSEQVVNTTIAGHQVAPAVAALADGGWVVTWDDLDTLSHSELMQQRFSADGQMVGGETLVSSPEGMADPQILAMADGGWAVVWMSSHTENFQTEFYIWMARYEADGQPIGSQELISVADYSMAHPSATLLADGSWIVSWYSSGSAENWHEYYPFFQHIAADGSLIGTEVRVESPYTWHIGVGCTALPDGGWLISYKGGQRDLFQQRFAADGSPVGDITHINTYTPKGINVGEFAPITAVLDDGGWVVVWSVHGEDGPHSDSISMQRFDADGIAIGQETRVNVEAFGNQYQPDVVALDDGGWIVFWTTETHIGGDTNVMARRYVASGRAIGDDIQINADTSGLQQNASVTVLADGNLVVAWQSSIYNQWGTLVGQDVSQRYFEVTPSYGGDSGNDTLTAGPTDSDLYGFEGRDLLNGGDGNDYLSGGEGADTLMGGAGADILLGGTSATDLSDFVFGGAGNDTIKGDYGNDNLRGDDGDDQIDGGFGSDTIIGGAGNDTVAGGAISDMIFGGAGDDYLNGGFGFDRMNGGTGADQFFNLGAAGHASDWVQDYSAAEGDELVFGTASATRDQFQINWAVTPGAGSDAVQEAFVIFRPTGQILWALVDGAAQDHIWLRLGATTYDLMV